MRSRLVTFLLTAGIAGVAMGSITLFAQSATDQADSSPVPTPTTDSQTAQENAKAGSTGWQSAELTRGRGRPLSEPKKGVKSAIPNAETGSPTFVPQVISGYAGLTSVNKGGAITLYISTAQPTYNIDVYRMGWYGGAGARLMTSYGGKTGQNQPTPVPDPTTGLIEANWSPSQVVQTASDWVSGIYLAKLTAADGSVGYVTFVVRDDSQVADIVYQVPVTTYEAYNDWGGKSLYDFSSTNGIQATKVSFDRPYAAWSGAGSFFDGDYNMVRWLEQRGYKVTYTTSIDTQTSPQLFTGRKVFLSNFHDEYWSKAMRDNVTAARDAGMDLAWFDANNMYWQIRFEDGTTAPNRRIVAYKESVDPITATNPALTTGTWRDAPVNKPENALLGVMYESNFTYGTGFPWVVQNPTHWIYKGTSVKNNDQIPGLVGYEYDKVWANGLTPAGLVTLSKSPVTDVDGIAGTQNGGFYTAASGAMVFAAGTVQWAWKLDDNSYQSHGADPRVQRMTINVLNAMISGVAGGTPVPTATPSPIGVSIYTDAVATGWSISSWGATVNNAATSPVYKGTKSIAFTVTSAWGALVFNAAAPFTTNGLTSLTFALRATNANQRYSVQVFSPAGAAIGKSVNLIDYGGNPSNTAFTVYTIPLDAQNLNVTDQAIGGFYLQDLAGAAQPAVYVDEVGFRGTQSPTPTPTNTPIPAPLSLTVYGDALAPGWVDGSWSSTVNLANSAPVSAGTKSIAFTVTAAWGALYVNTSAPVATTATSSLGFSLQASAAGQSYTAVLVNSTGAIFGNYVDLSTVGGDPVVGSWKSYDISLGAGGFNVGGQAVKGIIIQDRKGASQPVVYVDQLGFRGTTAPTPTATPPSPTATPIPPTATPTPLGPTATPTVIAPTATPLAPTATPTPAGIALPIYADALGSGWANSSWNATANLAATAPVFAGTKSIALTITSAWGALYVTNSTGVATTTYSSLKFSMQASAAGQRFSVSIVGSAGTTIGTVVLATAGGDPGVGTWTSYSIPLGAGGFNAAGQVIKGIYVQDYTGAAQPVVYVDEIKLQ